MASIYNQCNRLYHGAYITANQGSNEEVHKAWLLNAIDYIEKAIGINPQEPSYYFNLAICYRENNQIKDAETAIDKAVQLKTDDVDHLRLAYEIYIKVGNGEKAKEVKKKIQGISPIIATMLDM